MSLQNIIRIYSLGNSNLSDHDLQTLVESTFELEGYLIQLIVFNTRRYLHAEHNGDAGRRIHEVPIGKKVIYILTLRNLKYMYKNACMDQNSM